MRLAGNATDVATLESKVASAKERQKQLEIEAFAGRKLSSAGRTWNNFQGFISVQENLHGKDGYVRMNSCIIHPRSKLYAAWRSTCLVFITLTFFVPPLRLAFDIQGKLHDGTTEDMYWGMFTLTMTLFFTFDLVVQVMKQMHCGIICLITAIPDTACIS